MTKNKKENKEKSKELSEEYSHLGKQDYLDEIDN